MVVSGDVARGTRRARVRGNPKLTTMSVLGRGERTNRLIDGLGFCLWKLSRSEDRRFANTKTHCHLGPRLGSEWRCNGLF